MKNLRIAWTVCGFKSYSSEHFQAGEADDYEIICKDGSFGIHEHCLFSSEFLYKQHKARKNFDGKGKETKHLYCAYTTVSRYKLYLDTVVAVDSNRILEGF